MALALSGTSNGSLNNLSLSGNTATIVDTGKAGTVVQYKEQLYTTAFSTTSSSFVDAFTGFTFTPTSSTNKVRLEFFGRFYLNASGMDSQFRFVRDSTDLWTGTHIYGLNSAVANCSTLVYTDTPGTTSQVTYKLQGKRLGGTGTVYVATTSLYSGNPDAYFRAWEIVA